MKSLKIFDRFSRFDDGSPIYIVYRNVIALGAFRIAYREARREKFERGGREGSKTNVLDGKNEFARKQTVLSEFYRL